MFVATRFVQPYLRFSRFGDCGPALAPPPHSPLVPPSPATRGSGKYCPNIGGVGNNMNLKFFRYVRFPGLTLHFGAPSGPPCSSAGPPPLTSRCSEHARSLDFAEQLPPWAAVVVSLCTARSPAIPCYSPASKRWVHRFRLRTRSGLHFEASGTSESESRLKIRSRKHLSTISHRLCTPE